MTVKKVEVFVQYQPLIDQPPVEREALYAQSCRNDKVTIDSWRTTWIKQAKENKSRFGSFKDHGIGRLWGKHQYLPIIVAGSGPSLKGNAHLLKDRGAMPLVSCLHNFHYLEDQGSPADYYVSLDAGPVTIEEVYEGGTRTPEEYWELTKNRTLLCHISTHPELLAKWKGEILFFNCPMPQDDIEKELDDIEIFSTYVSTGGNVLGACLYIAKGYLGASNVIFVGADFCFSYDHKFHAWDSKYDKNLGQCVSLTDVYGIRRLTWQSYSNFKGWFDYVCLGVPGYFVNSSEGGCLGSYPQGNLSCMKYMDLADVFKMFNMNAHLKPLADKPEEKQKIILF
jgi:hypothetical protein